MKRMTMWCVMVLAVVGSIAASGTEASAQAQVDSLRSAQDSTYHFATTAVLSGVAMTPDSLRWAISGDASGWKASVSDWKVSPVFEEAVPQNVRITIQLIQANGYTDPDPAIADIVGELEQLFRFEGYRLLSEATMISELPTEDSDNYLSQRIAGRTPESSFEEVFGISLQLEPTGTAGIVRVRGQLVDAVTGEEILSVGFSARMNQTIVIGSSKYDPNKPTLIVAFRMVQAGD